MVSIYIRTHNKDSKIRT